MSYAVAALLLLLSRLRELRRCPPLLLFLLLLELFLQRPANLK